MKKVFAIALALVMVLGIATSAMAFSWAKPANAGTYTFGYDIDVIKFSRSTYALGSSGFNVDDSAVAVNGADVYYTIKLIVNGPSDDVKARAEAEVKFTALMDASAQNALTNSGWVNLSGLNNGVYYYDARTTSFQPIDQFVQNVTINKVAETPVYSSTCIDTATAKVEATVRSRTNLAVPLTANGYTIVATATSVAFTKNGVTITFPIDSNDKVTDEPTVTATPGPITGKEVTDLYAWLNNGSVDAIKNAIKNGEMYMTDANLRAAFGFNFSDTDSITWNASSTPIILDPTVGIPKTGDNASVVGFAMVMVAVVAAAVAVKKVKA